MPSLTHLAPFLLETAYGLSGPARSFLSLTQQHEVLKQGPGLTSGGSPVDETAGRNSEDRIALTFLSGPSAETRCVNVLKYAFDRVYKLYKSNFQSLDAEWKQTLLNEVLPGKDETELLRILETEHKLFSDEIPGCKEAMVLFNEGKISNLKDGIDPLHKGKGEYESRSSSFMYGDKKGRKKWDSEENMTNNLGETSKKNAGISHPTIDNLQNYWAEPGIFQGQFVFGPHDASCTQEACPVKEFNECGVPFVGGASGTLRLFLYLFQKVGDGYFKSDPASLLVFMATLVIRGHHSWTEMIMVAHEMGYLTEIASPLHVKGGCMGKELYPKMLGQLMERSLTMA